MATSRRPGRLDRRHVRAPHEQLHAAERVLPPVPLPRRPDLGTELLRVGVDPGLRRPDQGRAAALTADVPVDAILDLHGSAPLARPAARRAPDAQVMRLEATSEVIVI